MRDKPLSDMAGRNTIWRPHKPVAAQQSDSGTFSVAGGRSGEGWLCGGSQGPERAQVSTRVQCACQPPLRCSWC